MGRKTSFFSAFFFFRRMKETAAMQAKGLECHPQRKALQLWLDLLLNFRNICLSIGAHQRLSEFEGRVKTSF